MKTYSIHLLLLCFVCLTYSCRKESRIEYYNNTLPGNNTPIPGNTTPTFEDIPQLYGTRYFKGMRKVYVHHTNSQKAMDSTFLDSVRIDFVRYSSKDKNPEIIMYLPADTTTLEFNVASVSGDTFLLGASIFDGNDDHITLSLSYDTVANYIPSVYFDKWNEANPSPFRKYYLTEIK